MSEVIFYHVAPITLGEGSIIMPGNWGRMLMMHDALNPVLFREHVFELVRMKNFADKPSRLQCVFAVETADEAARYRAAHQPNGLIYEVRVEAEKCAVHRGNYDFTVSPDLTYPRGFHDLAHRYWSELRNDCIEVLIPAPVRIMRGLG